MVIELELMFVVWQASELGPMSESANLNPDLTSVSWVHEEDEKKILEDKNPPEEDKSPPEEDKHEDKKLEDKSAVEDKDGGDGLPEPALSTREI